MVNNNALKRKHSHKNNNKQNIIATQYSSGPLVLPENLQGYENIKVGFAERIVSMAERESSSRHNAQQRQITTEYICYGWTNGNYSSNTNSSKHTGLCTLFGV